MISIFHWLAFPSAASIALHFGVYWLAGATKYVLVPFEANSDSSPRVQITTKEVYRNSATIMH